MRFHVPSCKNLVVRKYLISQFVDKLIKAQVHLKQEFNVMFKNVSDTVKCKAKKSKNTLNVPIYVIKNGRKALHAHLEISNLLKS